jgi:CRISPR-associated endonuclease/helicase Cas3
LAWALSEITVREKRLRGTYLPTPALTDAACAARAGWGRFEDAVILLPLETDRDGVFTGTLLGEDGRTLGVRYTAVSGLRFD